MLTLPWHRENRDLCIWPKHVIAAQGQVDKVLTVENGKWKMKVQKERVALFTSSFLPILLSLLQNQLLRLKE